MITLIADFKLNSFLLKCMMNKCFYYVEYEIYAKEYILKQKNLYKNLYKLTHNEIAI